MKKVYFLFLQFCILTVHSQTIFFPDSAFKARLLMASPTYQIAKNLSGNWVKIDSNSDNEIQVNEAQQISYLKCDSFLDNIYSITGVGNFSNLTSLQISSLEATTLDLAGLNNLQTLIASNNNFITDCTISNLPNLTTLSVDHSAAITSLTLTELNNLQSVTCVYNPAMTVLNTNTITSLTYLDCFHSALSSLDISSLTNLQTLKCGFNNFNVLEVNGLNALETLECSALGLSELNLAGLFNLKNLTCSNNPIGTLDFTGLTQITKLSCALNQLTSLSLSNFNLEYLNVLNNSITSLDLSQQVNLKTLYCSYNPNLAVNVLPLVNLEDLQIANNNLNTLDLSACTKLKILKCYNNELTTLDLSNQNELVELYAYDNPSLVSLFIKNGSIETTTALSSCPALSYICADLEQIEAVLSSLTPLTQIEVNSYCTFVPGGTFYNITGNCHFDNDDNGCSTTDLIYPNLEFSISNGASIGNLISNQSGIFSIPVQTGIHTLTPILENPEYFSVTPASITLDLPQDSTLAQSFCITRNGNHNDLEVVLIPIDIARPGFNAHYKIIYINKGTTTQSGSIGFNFDPNLSNFVSASSDPIFASGNLSWGFSDLMPLEKREIIVTLNINSPMDVPAVNGGDVLTFAGLVSSSQTDELPNDNIFELIQTIVNSLDPNDKTCLEGQTITPEMVGQYVHYMIRFENTGTANAQNIVVKDIIDSTKFDINTLIPINGSHDFTTRISGNNVEFLFENINLPFDQAINSGFVAFKIKTKSSLSVGESFSNSAGIYFDYNFPIATNTATTSINNLLRQQEVTQEGHFSIYPNPTSTLLQVKNKKSLATKSICIYNVWGQLLLTKIGAESSIDVSALETGVYFIEINADNASSVLKFIKK